MNIFSKKQTKQETIIYTIVWIVLFLSPLVSFFVGHEDTTMDETWVRNSLLDSWLTLLSFLVVFLIHNYVLAPILVKHKRVKVYLITCVALIGVFQLAQCTHRPNGQPLISAPEMRVPPPRPPKGAPPVDKHDLSMFIIMVMMIGGNLGVKSGKGFYIYNADRTKTPMDA